MTIIIILLHLIIDILCGFLILSKIEKSNRDLFFYVKAIGIGMFVDTMILGVLNFLGISILYGFIAFSIVTILLFIKDRINQEANVYWMEPIFKGRLSIWEIVILIFIVEKLVWSLFNLAHLPVYFDDALSHWSGRGKALLFGINWSWDSDSPYFLGQVFGHMEYPLFLNLWRATNSVLLNGASGASERADSFIMALIVCLTTLTWIYHKTGKRWLGLIGVYIICAIPLEIWHMSAGYAEIFIQAYLLLAMWSIMNDKYVQAGIFSAALIWSKNEGLIVFVPCILLCLSLRLLLNERLHYIEKLYAFLKYNFTWIIAIGPWLLFKLINGVGFTTPTDKGITYVPGTLTKMFVAVFNSPSSSILWIFIFLAGIMSIQKILEDKELYTLSLGALILLVMVTFVFTCTGAYVFLENEMTIHRTLLQIAPIFIIVVVLALSKTKISKTSINTD